ncbi:aminopeptidase P family protein [Ideonella livida]|uniref:Aminopeptidase P family protein n=1 Tax=Ideonella livida TaxID=2707176 RepID=A0A7C9TJZ2_9BURK|nr:aminopeptidase P family protein [Ideonella livida]NDY90567.1 aminopeptidase P family protein [Ideonella livida]
MDVPALPVTQRLAALRAHLLAMDAHAVLVPSSDPHLSEYLPGHWQGREWFSGFTGSMGTLVVTRDQAALFADSRYWEQAEAELKGSGIDLVRIPTGAATHHLEWITRQLERGQRLLVDGDVLGLAAARQLQATCVQAGIEWVTDRDPLAAAWPERPGLPAEPVYAHAAPFATQPRQERLAAVRAEMARLGATHHLVSSLDDVAWLTLLRGADVDYNPVFLAHLLLDMSSAELFVGTGKVPAAVQAVLAADGVQLKPYADLRHRLASLEAPAVVLLDPRRVTWGFRQALPESVRVVESLNPSTLAKSRKSEAEAAHVREAMVQDGVAMCRFYAWLEAALSRGETVTELTIDERMTAERRLQPGFVGLSFPTIAGFNGNGAMPHYRATPASFATIQGDGLLLIDSGAQYLGGTTDITRVWPVGQVSAEHRRDYTLVLKGTLALSRARFPLGTPAPFLDSLARAPLWAQSLDYGHGTGHGVGYFLNVHEGPQTISKAMPEPHTAMLPGMITSVEPGLYRPGRWGVRIENLVLNVPAPAGEFGEFLAFETLTLCPIDTRCLDLSLLRADELDWLDDYHATVRARLAPHLQGEALTWLVTRTEPVHRTC